MTLVPVRGHWQQMIGAGAMCWQSGGGSGEDLYGWLPCPTLVMRLLLRTCPVLSAARSDKADIDGTSLQEQAWQR